MEWISVKDRLPENEDVVAVICEDGIVAAYLDKTYIAEGQWHASCCCIHEVENPYHVTHWIPMPKRPEQV